MDVLGTLATAFGALATAFGALATAFGALATASRALATASRTLARTLDYQITFLCSDNCLGSLVLHQTALSDSLIRQPHQTASSDSLIRQPHQTASSDSIIRHLCRPLFEMNWTFMSNGRYMMLYSLI